MAKRTERPIRVKGSLWGALTSGRLEKAVDRNRRNKRAVNRKRHNPRKNK